MQPQDFIISIDKRLVAEFPIATFQGDITLVQTEEEAEEAVRILEKYPLVGFDTETKPSFKKGKPNKVALMQLSTYDQCFLFRLNKIGLTPAIARFLENERILKVGLSVHDDFHVMHRSSDVVPKGFLELQEYVKKYKIADISLQKVYAILFEEKISKNQRLTNWEAEELTRGQQLYAATDAWACLRIYNFLESGLFDPNESKYKTMPPQPAAKQDNPS